MNKMTTIQKNLQKGYTEFEQNQQQQCTKYIHPKLQYDLCTISCVGIAATPHAYRMYVYPFRSIHTAAKRAEKHIMKPKIRFCFEIIPNKIHVECRQWPQKCCASALIIIS